MEERIVSVNKLAFFRQDQINYHKLLKVLEKKYKSAFKKYLEENSESKLELSVSLEQFIKSSGVDIHCRQANPLKEEFNGTYCYRIDISQDIATALNRRGKQFSYYGLKSMNSAIEKSIEKAFHIIDCLLTGKELPDNILRE